MPDGTAVPPMGSTHLELLDWRRRTAALYADVRAAAETQESCLRWRAGRDELFQEHPQSPLPDADPLRAGLPYWPYDPAFRFTARLSPPTAERDITLPSTDGDIRLVLAGSVHLPDPVDADVDVWWLGQYGGGLFLPLRDGTAGRDSYGGGRYLLDTVKGADLGSATGKLVLDLNFLYHPSCRYSPLWACPLAPPGNRVAAHVRAGERMSRAG